ncbi:hypothetical protein CRUP_034453 [Coryphaenoides rupestris]|nr:hypothetical protein CRUP_034453 [Coryphaenoides rupestris]
MSSTLDKLDPSSWLMTRLHPDRPPRLRITATEDADAGNRRIALKDFPPGLTRIVDEPLHSEEEGGGGGEGEEEKEEEGRGGEEERRRRERRERGEEGEEEEEEEMEEEEEDRGGGGGDKGDGEGGRREEEKEEKEEEIEEEEEERGGGRGDRRRKRRRWKLEVSCSSSSSVSSSFSSSLPLEMIVYIMEFLHAWDRKEASAVCRHWYHASQDPRFQKNVTYRFPASASSVGVIRSLGGRSGCSLVISQLDGSSLSRVLLMEVSDRTAQLIGGQVAGSHLEGLSLPGSSLTEASLLALLPHLTALRRLDLSGLDSLLCALGPVRPEELNLSHLRYLHIAFEFDPYRGCPAGAARDSSALLSLRNLRRLLVEQSSTLVALDLSRTSITPQTLRTIAQELCLQGSKELTGLLCGGGSCSTKAGLLRLDLSGSRS